MDHLPPTPASTGRWVRTFRSARADVRAPSPAALTRSSRVTS